MAFAFARWGVLGLGAVVAVGLSVACGGRVEVLDPIDPAPEPTPVPTTTSTSPTPLPSSTGSSTTPTRPGSKTKSCDPTKCVIPHGTARCNEDGECVAATCEGGYGTCSSAPNAPCELFVRWYYDADGDGYGSSETYACPNAGEWKGNLVKKDGDCDDTDPSVHPGQTLFFLTPTKKGSFDYDCSGKAERQEETKSVYCLCSDFGCSINEGWVNEVPSCGETGSWGTGNGSTCTPLESKRIQGCR